MFTSKNSRLKCWLCFRLFLWRTQRWCSVIISELIYLIGAITYRAYLPTLMHWMWNSLICRWSHAINRYLRISCILQMSSHILCILLILNSFFHGHTSEIIKYYKQKNWILGIDVHLSSNRLLQICLESRVTLRKN